MITVIGLKDKYSSSGGKGSWKDVIFRGYCNSDTEMPDEEKRVVEDRCPPHIFAALVIAYFMPELGL